MSKSAAQASAPVQGAAEDEASIALRGNVVARLSLPWDALFRDIEASVDSNAVLLSIESNPEQGSLSLTGEARNLNAMLDYARRLGGGTLLQDVEIVSHQLLVQDTLRPVKFVIRARLIKHPITQRTT